MDKNRLTAREVVVSAAREEIASREARIAEIRSEEIQLEDQLQPLYEQRQALCLNKRVDERTIMDCEKIIDGRLGWFQRPKMGVEQARAEMRDARERVPSATKALNDLAKQIEPLGKSRDKLSSERIRLEHEVAVYRKIVSSKGSLNYDRAEEMLTPRSRACMA